MFSIYLIFLMAVLIQISHLLSSSYLSINHFYPSSILSSTFNYYSNSNFWHQLLISFEIRCPLVNTIVDCPEDRVLTLLQHHQKVCLCLLVLQVYWKLVEQFSQSLHVHVLDPAVQHQVEQVVNHFRVLPQKQVRFKTFWLEDLEVFTLCSSHRINHFLSDLNWRRIRFWIPSQDEAKVNMEHFAVGRDQQIFQVPITNAEKICDRAVPSTAKNIIFHDQFWILIHFLKLLEMLLNLDVLESLSFRNEFNVTIGLAACQSLVRSESVVLIDTFEELVHERKHFENELILSEIITVFINERETTTILSLKSQLERSHGWVENGTFWRNRKL